MVALTHKPTPGRLIAPYGWRAVLPTPTSPRIHYGEDWGWHETTTDPIYAAAPGVVVAYADAGAYGRRMIVRHDDGSEAWYCHTSSAVAEIGDRVKAGDVIARIGATGNTTAPHRHMEIRVDGAAVDPGPLWDLSAPAGGLDETPIPTEEEHMKCYMVQSTNPATNETSFAIHVPGTPYWDEFTASGAYATERAKQYETGDAARITWSHFVAMRAETDAMKPRDRIEVRAVGDTDE
jgi:murein DD-endopeptidase MepM/ murein hydrolase activator NlpD